MKTIITIVVTLCVSIIQLRAQAVDSLFLQAAIQKLQHAMTYTLHTAELMPAEAYQFKPSEEEMTFARQLLHISENLGWLSSSYLKKESNPVSKKELTLMAKDSVITIVKRAYNYSIDALKNVKPGQLQDEVNFFAGPMNKLQIINLMNDHQTHHRGQLMVYLRLRRIKPPAYIGW